MRLFALLLALMPLIVTVKSIVQNSELEVAEQGNQNIVQPIHRIPRPIPRPTLIRNFNPATTEPATEKPIVLEVPEEQPEQPRSPPPRIPLTNSRPLPRPSLPRPAPKPTNIGVVQDPPVVLPPSRPEQDPPVPLPVSTELPIVLPEPIPNLEEPVQDPIPIPQPIPNLNEPDQDPIPIPKPTQAPIPNPEPEPEPQPEPEPDPIPLEDPELQVRSSQPQPNIPRPRPVQRPNISPLNPQRPPLIRTSTVTYPPLRIIPDPEPKPEPQPLPEPNPIPLEDPEPIEVETVPVRSPQPQPNIPRPRPVQTQRPPIIPTSTIRYPPLRPVPKPVSTPKPPPPTPKPVIPQSTPKPNPYDPKYIPNSNGDLGIPVAFDCRQDDYYAVPNECDTYIECRGRDAAKYSCPDGLRFNPLTRWPEYPCSYPMEVRCDSKAITQPPQPTEQCPRQYGYFPLDGDCSRYKMCQAGVAMLMDCPQGLAFDVSKSSCDWPENVPSCKPNIFQGFTCPPAPLDEYGTPIDITYNYKYGQSCKQYVACQRGYPRLLSCDSGLAFDDDIGSCIDSDYVQNC